MEQSIIEKRKEAIAKLPYYRGEVPSKNAIRKLPKVAKGEVFWVDMENKPYIVSNVTEDNKVTIIALDETATITTGITVYDLNHSIIAKEPVFNWEDKDKVDTLNDQLHDWFYNTTKDSKYYLLYGRGIHYVTLIKKNYDYEDFKPIELFKEMFDVIGELISMEIDNSADGEKKIEIWVRTHENPAELLYLFPYDDGIVEL